MTSPDYHPWVCRLAIVTACAALVLTIPMGAQVTTTGAGMAFPDWPTSDGHNMFLYPWLQSAGDKFLEHGHRLAGSLVGMLSIALAFVTWKLESRRWVRFLGLAVLGTVIFQGILGGKRVLLDARGLALLHGVFASWTFALMISAALVTSRGWISPPAPPANWSRSWKWSALTTTLLVAVQYFLGAVVRHRGTVIYEHAGFAFLVLLAALWTAYGAVSSGTGWLRRPAVLLTVAAVLQIALGLVTYVVKFGLGETVVTQGSLLQVTIRTSHVLLGMLVWSTAVVCTLRTWRIDALVQDRQARPAGVTVPEFQRSLTMPGGLG